MRPKHNKPQAQRAIKKSVSMPLTMFIQASELQRQFMLPAFSDLVQMLIRDRIQMKLP